MNMLCKTLNEVSFEQDLIICSSIKYQCTQLLVCCSRAAADTAHASFNGELYVLLCMELKKMMIDYLFAWMLRIGFNQHTPVSSGNFLEIFHSNINKNTLAHWRLLSDCNELQFLIKL